MPYDVHVQFAGGGVKMFLSPHHETDLPVKQQSGCILGTFQTFLQSQSVNSVWRLLQVLGEAPRPSTGVLSQDPTGVKISGAVTAHVSRMWASNTWWQDKTRQREVTDAGTTVPLSPHLHCRYSGGQYKPSTGCRLNRTRTGAKSAIRHTTATVKWP